MCIQNSVPCLPLELLVSMGHNPLLWFCAFNTATFGTLLHVSMCPKPHLWFCAWTTASLASEYLGSMGPSPHLWFCMHNSDFWTRITSLYWSHTSLSFCASNTAWLAPELIVSMGPSPHLWLLHAKQKLLDQNCMSLCVPDLTCRFVHAKQRDYYQNY